MKSLLDFTKIQEAKDDTQKAHKIVQKHADADMNHAEIKQLLTSNGISHDTAHKVASDYRRESVEKEKVEPTLGISIHDPEFKKRRATAKKKDQGPKTVVKDGKRIYEEQHLVHVNDGSKYDEKPHPTDVEHVMTGVKKHNGEFEGHSDKGALFKFKSKNDAEDFKSHVNKCPNKSCDAHLSESIDEEVQQHELKRIHKEYLYHKSRPTADVLKTHKGMHRVQSQNYTAGEMGGKEGLISDIMHNAHGKQRMDAYHSLSSKHKKALSEETLDEISQETKASYVTKASKDVTDRRAKEKEALSDNGAKRKNYPEFKDYVKKTNKREKVVSKMSNEELDEASSKVASGELFKHHLDKAIEASKNGAHNRAKYHLDIAKTARYGMNGSALTKHKEALGHYKELQNNYTNVKEEIVNEISKDTLTSYAHKAFSHGNQLHTDIKNTDNKSEKEKLSAKLSKRNKGVIKASEKMKKEDIISFNPNEAWEQFSTKNLEEESIDEISKATLGSYVKKASDQAKQMALTANFSARGASDALDKGDPHLHTLHVDNYKYAKKLDKKRTAGVSKAVDKLTKEEVEEFMQTEAYDQLDELSKKTLGTYVKKASLDVGTRGLSNNNTLDAKHLNTLSKMSSRIKNINKAVDKLTKEEVEELDENDHPRHFVDRYNKDLERKIDKGFHPDYDRKMSDQEFEAKLKQRAKERKTNEEVEPIDEAKEHTFHTYGHAVKKLVDKYAKHNVSDTSYGIGGNFHAQSSGKIEYAPQHQHHGSYSSTTVHHAVKIGSNYPKDKAKAFEKEHDKIKVPSGVNVQHGDNDVRPHNLHKHDEYGRNFSTRGLTIGGENYHVHKEEKAFAKLNKESADIDSDEDENDHDSRNVYCPHCGKNHGKSSEYGSERLRRCSTCGYDSSKKTTKKTQREDTMLTYSEFMAQLAESKADDLRDKREADRESRMDSLDFSKEKQSKNTAKRSVKGNSYGAGEEGEGEDDKDTAKPDAVKRGRGRPSGSKSGARI